MGSIRDAQGKLNLQRGAIDDLDEKTREVEDNVKSRENELEELKRLIDSKAEAGRNMQADATTQANKNR